MEKYINCTGCTSRLKVSGQVDKSHEVPQTATCPNCNEPNEVMWPMNGGYSVSTRCAECEGTGRVGVAFRVQDGVDANAGGRVQCDKCRGTGTITSP